MKKKACNGACTTTRKDQPKEAFTPVPGTPAVGPSAGVRPRVTNCGGKGTKAKQRTVILRDPHTDPTVRISADVRPLGEDGGDK